MKIKINDKEFLKNDLLKLISESKLEAIKSLKDVLKIGLKDSKVIVDNLYENPNFYENDIIKIKYLDKSEVEVSTKNRNTKKRGTHFIQEDNQTKKKGLIFGLIFIIIVLLYIFLNTHTFSKC